MAALSPEAQKALGTTGERSLGPDANGIDLKVPDDIGLGKGAFEGAYKTSKGKLEDQQKLMAVIASSLNTLKDPNASAAEKLTAQAALVAAAVTGVLYGAQVVGLITAATVSASVPIIGWAAAAFVAAALLMVTLINSLLNNAVERPYQNTPIDFAIMSIPTRMAFENVPLTADGIAAARFVGQLLAAQRDPLRQGDAEYFRLQLAQYLGNDTGKADQLAAIVARVVDNPRWGLGSLPGVEPDINRERIQASRDPRGLLTSVGVVNGPRRNTYNDLALLWANQFPGFFELGVEAGVYADPNGPYGSENAKRNYSNSVITYLELYAAAAIVAGIPTPDSFAYMAFYNLLIARGWVYKAASRPIPDEEYACQGFLLDLISQTPMARIRNSRFDLVGTAIEKDAPVLVKDAQYFIRYYLDEEAKSNKGAPFIPSSNIPDGPKGGGAQQPQPEGGVFNPNRPGGGISVRGIG